MTSRIQATAKQVVTELVFKDHQEAAQYYKNLAEYREHLLEHLRHEVHLLQERLQEEERLNCDRHRSRRAALLSRLGTGTVVGLAVSLGILRWDGTQLGRPSQILREVNVPQLLNHWRAETLEFLDNSKFTQKNYSSIEGIPENAFEVGYEHYGAPLFLCLANYQGVLHVGKVVGEACNIPSLDDGKEVRQENFAVVVDMKQHAWLFTKDQVAAKPLKIDGWSVCRASYNGGLHPGIVDGSHCYISYENTVHAIEEYETLVAPQQPLMWVTDLISQTQWPKAFHNFLSFE